MLNADFWRERDQLIMPRGKRKKPETISFDEYLSLLSGLKGDALKEWNQESMRRSRLLQEEFFETSKANIQKYLSQLLPALMLILGYYFGRKPKVKALK